jgi:predicted Zn-dependent protease
MRWAQHRRKIGWPGAVAIALTFAACSSLVPGARETLLPDLPNATANDSEVDRAHQRILAAYGGGYKDARLEALLDRTVDRLVTASERPDLKYKVTVLNSPNINAFALPAGQLYVTRGLAALANDTSELASVMAHEMAHVIADHASMRQDQAQQAAIASRVVSDVLSDPSVGALALAKSKIALASFSRAQELEADGIGVGIAARAGFDPYGAARFLTAMGRNAELRAGASGSGAHAADLLSTYPATPDRIKNAQLNARQFSAPGAGERDKANYLAALDGLVYGEDPADGYARGRRFIHPRLGFTFVVPEGFTIDNDAQAVLGVKEGGTQAMRFDTVSVPADQTLASYLTSGWMENADGAILDDTSLQDFTIGGFPAATATAKGQQWSYRVYAMRFGRAVYRFIYAAETMTPAADQAFRSSFESFRRLSVSESEAAKPLRLKVRTVRPDDTVDSLARRHMANLDHQVERFRVLNGLGSGEPVKAGEQVKTVVE